MRPREFDLYGIPTSPDAQNVPHPAPASPRSPKRRAWLVSLGLLMAVVVVFGVVIWLTG